MINDVFKEITPEMEALVSQLKVLFPVVVTAALLWAKISANAETDENEAKRKEKRVKQILIGVPTIVIMLLIITLFAKRI